MLFYSFIILLYYYIIIFNFNFNYSPSLIWPLLRTVGYPVIIAFFLKLTNDILIFVGPNVIGVNSNSY